MLTRKRFIPPTLTGDWTADGPRLLKAISDYLLSLEQKGAITLTAATIDLDGGQLKFPATQNAFSDVNTLDDYEESSTTPTVTASSGSFTTVSASVKATKVGDRVSYTANVTITTNGTAAIAVKVPLPYTPAEVTGACGIESALTGTGLCGYANTDGNLYIFKYDGTYPGADGRTLNVEGSYRV